MNKENLHFIVFGRTQELAKAELSAVSRYLDIKVEPHTIGLDASLFEIKGKSEKIWDKVGGIIKTGKIVAEYKSFEEINEFTLQELIPKADTKVNFGISLYALGKNSRLQAIKPAMDALGKETKKLLKEEKRSSRFVSSKDIALSSVAVRKEKLLRRGVDICFFVTPEKIYIGITEWTQDFDRFSKIDYGRPKADHKSGMCPPKLARMMVNLATPGAPMKVLDPFCGSGTILMEAAEVGHQVLFGSDSSPKAISDSNQNLKWYAKVFNRQLRINVNLAEVHKLSQTMSKGQVNIIVTEPYLGPQRGRIKLDQTIPMLTRLYMGAWRQFALILPKGGRVCMILPVFKVEDQNDRYIQIRKDIEKLGFIQLGYPDWVEVSDRGSLRYARPHARIEREIFVWEKT